MAAGQCIRLLAEHMEHFTPLQVAVRAGVSSEDLYGKQTDRLLNKFDIASVLANGRALLQSGGEV